jgi:diguanylate cyclase (GGDEF)-like protein
MRAIAAELQDLRSVAAAVLDPSGVLLEANAGFMNLLGSSPARRIGANVALLFNKPGFGEWTAAKVAEGGHVYSGSIRVIDSTGQVLDLPGNVWRTSFGFCIVAEYDIDQVRNAAEKRSAAGTEQKQVRLVEAALTDRASGVGTREKLEEALNMEISRVRRTGLPLAALIARIDALTGLADQGQNAVDPVLARVGFLLRLLTRPTDVAARLDADKFVVLLPHTRLEQGQVVLQRIQKALGTEAVPPLPEPPKASLGAAEFEPGEDAAVFLKRLESALPPAS